VDLDSPMAAAKNPFPHQSLSHHFFIVSALYSWLNLSSLPAFLQLFFDHVPLSAYIELRIRGAPTHHAGELTIRPPQAYYLGFGLFLCFRPLWCNSVPNTVWCPELASILLLRVLARLLATKFWVDSHDSMAGVDCLSIGRGCPHASHGLQVTIVP